MKRLIDILCDLFKPRTLIAFLFYGAFIYLVITEKAIPEPLKLIVASLMSFYFGQRTRKGVTNGVGLNGMDK